MSAITARAHSNIALIKYWGKRHEALKLPLNGSLSLTLDQLFTDTTVSPAEHDCFTLNGIEITGRPFERVQHFLHLVRAQHGINEHLHVSSLNHVPTAAGLASSASAFAALALALSAYWQLDQDPIALSRLARQGSGSASRSVYGNFAEWLAGTESDGRDSYAVPVNSQLQVEMAVLVLQSTPKKTPSGEGMSRTVQSSPLYSGWTQTVNQDLIHIKEALAAGDLEAVGTIMEHNALAMHASAIAARPPVLYWLPESVSLMHYIWELREQGHACWFTLDAGPNLKVLLPPGAESTLNALRQHPALQELILCGPGPAAHLRS